MKNLETFVLTSKFTLELLNFLPFLCIPQTRLGC